MSVFLTIIAVIVIFSILVLIHEYGHFIVARRSGIKVLEFGIGFPPRIFKKKIGETLYTINAIPFGGFVRLLGEDASDSAVLKNKHSYAGKSPWTRTKVVIAGVCMNFLLAIVLLTIGFSFGIEPLLVTEQDLFYHLEQGNVRTAPGVFVAGTEDAVSKLGILKGEMISAIDDKPVKEVAQLKVFQKGGAVKDIDLTLVNQKGEARKVHVPAASKSNDFGIKLKPYTEFPRIVVLEVKAGSASAKAGIKKGDILLKVNGKEVYLPEEFGAEIAQSASAKLTVFRNGEMKDVSVPLPDSKHVVIADVFEKTVASSAGFLAGDIILSITPSHSEVRLRPDAVPKQGRPKQLMRPEGATLNGTVVTEPEQVQEILRKNPGQDMTYILSRAGKELKIKAATGEGNLLGVALSNVASFKNQEISVYRGVLLTSIIEIKNVRYNPWDAFKQAISESVRLTGYTVAAFGKTVGQIFSHFSVPEEVGGPVQIAYYTHTFVQEGFFALLRFTALLSLSLAVINVLPIPALDGGKLLFIVAEVVLRRKINARFESTIHLIGFALMILLLLMVTYSDIVRLF